MSRFSGQYGGEEFQGELPDDNYEPRRFFSFLSNEHLKQLGELHFAPVSFNVVQIEEHADEHFQSTLWRRT